MQQLSVSLCISVIFNLATTSLFTSYPRPLIPWANKLLVLIAVWGKGVYLAVETFEIWWLHNNWILTAVVFITAIRAVFKAIAPKTANNAVEPIWTSKKCGCTLWLHLCCVEGQKGTYYLFVYIVHYYNESQWIAMQWVVDGIWYHCTEFEVFRMYSFWLLNC